MGGAAIPHPTLPGISAERTVDVGDNLGDRTAELTDARSSSQLSVKRVKSQAQVGV